MEFVLGSELNHARATLENEGYTVVCVEVRSKKGVDGDICRVIRQRLIGDNTIELCFSCFACNCSAKGA